MRGDGDPLEETTCLTGNCDVVFGDSDLSRLISDVDSSNKSGFLIIDAADCCCDCCNADRGAVGLPDNDCGDDRCNVEPVCLPDGRTDGGSFIDLVWAGADPSSDSSSDS